MTEAFSRGFSKMKDNFTEGRGDYPPPGKEGQMEWCCVAEPEEAKKEFIITLKYDLANTYYWSGNFFKDYIFFVAQWHPLLGILLCHPYHPWTKRERFQMTLISVFITMPASVTIAKKADGDPVIESLETMLTVLFVTIPDTIIGVLLYQLSIADTRCPVCAGFWNLINAFCMNCFLVVGLISSGICYLILSGTSINFVKAFTPLIMGKAYSYLSWFPIWFVLPCMGYLHEWWMERKALLAEQELAAQQGQEAGQVEGGESPGGGESPKAGASNNEPVVE